MKSSLYGIEKMKAEILIILTVVSLVVTEEGDLCTKSGKRGTCKIFHDCEPAIDELKKYKTNPKICSWEGDEPIVCCVEKNKYVGSGHSGRDGGQCGVMVPGGFKVVNGIKQKKTNARSVLKGEYPWTAWIFRKFDDRPLCAGTIVEEKVDFVLTSATCVHKYSGTDLIVSFSRRRDEEIDVEAIKVHENYESELPNINDIAILVLNKTRERTPLWVKPVCQPDFPPMHATTCTTIADMDNFINPVIPLPEMCKIENKELHISQICATAPANDYDPETGAGLFCPNSLHTDSSNFYIYGIALEQHESITIYTNVSHFMPWIFQKISLSP